MTFSMGLKCEDQVFKIQLVTQFFLNSVLSFRKLYIWQIMVQICSEINKIKFV